MHTWWLLVLVISLNGVDWAAFEILNVRIIRGFLQQHPLTFYSHSMEAYPYLDRE